MNHLTPNQFREQLDAAMPESDGAVSAAVDQDIALGSRLLRRRRTAMAAGACSVVAVIAVGSTLVTRGDVGTAPEPAAPGGTATSTTTTAPMSADERLIEDCRSARDQKYFNKTTTRQMWAGTPTVKLRTDTAAHTNAVIESEDRKLWVNCQLPKGDASNQSEATLSPYTQPPYYYRLWSAVPFCPDQPNEQCDRFSLSYIQYLPDEVAAVRMETVDGKVTTVDSKDGHVAFNLLGRLPNRTAPAPPGQGYFDVDVVSRVDYLDAQGNWLAANRYENGDPVDVPGIPSMEDFWGPSQ